MSRINSKTLRDKPGIFGFIRIAPIVHSAVSGSVALMLALLSVACDSEDRAPFDFSTSRGMNLIDLSGPGWYPPGKIRAADLEMMQTHGFNQARMPLDYRLFTVDGKPGEIDERKIKDVDQGIQLARDHKIHSTLCLFTVPGYSVNEKDQNPSLWSDEALQGIFVDYWAYFAKRYRNIPPRELSFNLINEPPWGLAEKTYADLMLRAIRAIREIDPNRQIIIDGLESGRLPVMSLAKEPLTIQSAHFYEPFELTHYRADWLEDSGSFPTAKVWPLPIIPHHLLGPKQDHHSSLLLEGDFSGFDTLQIDLEDVLLSPTRPMLVSLSGESEKPIFKAVEPVATWRKIKSHDEGKLVEYRADSSIEIRLPQRSRRIALAVEQGDRLTFRAIRLLGPDGARSEDLRPTSREWISHPGVIGFDPEKGFSPSRFYDQGWIKEYLKGKWGPLMELGVPVVVHEFGCNYLLPHETALAYLGDCRAAFEDAKMGWSFFSNTGTLGIFESRRSDVSLKKLPDGRMMDEALFEVLTK